MPVTRDEGGGRQKDARSMVGWCSVKRCGSTIYDLRVRTSTIEVLGVHADEM